MQKKIIAIGACILVLVVAIGIMQWRAQTADQEIQELANSYSDAIEEQAISAANYINAVEEQVSNSEPASGEPSATAPKPSFSIQVENNVLTIGELDAPVTMLEFSSLSCPHCATFHKTTLPTLIEDYVSTGELKIVFNDFPLNKPALDASLLLQCFDAKDRYEFMEVLFAQQNQWAFDPAYSTKLKQFASLLGLSSQKADECMTNQATERALLEKLQENGQKHQVSSTPTFVFVESNKKLSGAMPYPAFSTEIEAILKAAE